MTNMNVAKPKLKLKPNKIWIVGGVAAAAIVFYEYRKAKSSSAETGTGTTTDTTDTGIDPATGIPYSQEQTDPTTGIPYADEGTNFTGAQSASVVDPNTGVPYSSELGAAGLTFDPATGQYTSVGSMSSNSGQNTVAASVTNPPDASQIYGLPTNAVGYVRAANGLIAAVLPDGSLFGFTGPQWKQYLTLHPTASKQLTAVPTLTGAQVYNVSQNLIAKNPVPVPATTTK